MKNAWKADDLRHTPDRIRPKTTAPPHVLIVEDDPDLRDLFVTVARLQGCSTETAENGLEGLSKLRARRPSLVILDLMMPVMTGWEFRQHQLSDPDLADVPVLCISAVADLEHHRRQLRADCMAKPVDTELLEAALGELHGGGRVGGRSDGPPDVSSVGTASG